ncbi:Type III restriction endonuclease, res subunit [Methanocaldococcus lauensis]|uniref:Type III restriction endonuclease, res subunit n=1 Tax=Methanocaldococcus lauensis TaxID=2546128 RepID=A0A8D6PQF4_9EURY|nr:helicase-related protein [Methanocaldococcus lauensis]CAB3288017.1 Type III restriction endonuclease, res subunit [Methanocaldococcus lauensis]
MNIKIQPGCIIKSPKLKEPFIVEMVNNVDDTIKIIGYYINSRELDYFILTPEEFKDIEIILNPLDFKGNPEGVMLAIESLRYQFASLYDPILAVSVSKISPLPFQIDAVYNYILKNPQIRFLLADDPGAGKTIMAGLVIKELKLRGLAERILIVVPGNLIEQWRRELKEKFQEEFVVVNRNAVKNNMDIWRREKQLIASIDFLKQEDIRKVLETVSWDLVIVDEAHKLAAYKFGNKVQRTKRYKVGNILSQNSTHLLFLTATPHKGDQENFRLLLDLLVPGLFTDKEVLLEAIRNNENPIFLRRMKEDLVDLDGKKIFKPRISKTISFNLTNDEMELYNELSKYIRDRYTMLQGNRRNIIFPLIILQRRFASSLYALLKSLKRRKSKLQEFLKNGKFEEYTQITIDDLLELEDEEEKERWKRELEMETIPISIKREQIEEEIKTIDRLIEMTEDLIKSKEETKLKKLKEILEIIKKEHGENEKVLIFTEFKDTLEYLVKTLEDWGYKVTYIHGEMSMDERIKREKEFKDTAQVMVATEAAGEGINLQFCHLLINYDIPWNPNRLEQRIGRVHRYGQKYPVYIFNFVAKNTREGIVLERVLKKLEEIRKALGDKVFDVIGELFNGENLYKALTEIATMSKDPESVLQEEINLETEEIREKAKIILEESLATKHIDLSKIRKLLEEAEANKLSPEYLEIFFIKAMKYLGAKVREKKPHIFSIEKVPRVIREIAKIKGYGEVQRSYKEITFDKKIAESNDNVEFVSFGHPLFEALRHWCYEEFIKDLQRGAIFYDPKNKLHGVIWFFEGEIRDGFNNIAGKTLIAVYDDGEKFEIIDPKIIWDLEPAKDSPNISVDFKRRDNAIIYAHKAADKYKDKLMKERMRQAKIKKKYGEKSLKKLISDIDFKLAEYELLSNEEKKRKALAIKNYEERLNRYKKALKELPEKIKRETSLTAKPPVYIGAIYVLPKGTMGENPEIEEIGMKIAMEYERRHGREPKDVSKENLGYDIYSEGNGERRYIEVKARAKLGDVELTWNEYVTAKRLGDKHWLYVVAYASENPTLYIIRDPANSLKIVEKYEIRFKVPVEEWRKKGLKVDI